MLSYNIVHTSYEYYLQLFKRNQSSTYAVTYTRSTYSTLQSTLRFQRKKKKKKKEKKYLIVIVITKSKR